MIHHYIAELFPFGFVSNIIFSVSKFGVKLGVKRVKCLLQQSVLEPAMHYSLPFVAN